MLEGLGIGEGVLQDASQPVTESGQLVRCQGQSMPIGGPGQAGQALRRQAPLEQLHSYQQDQVAVFGVQGHVDSARRGHDQPR